MDEAQLEDLKRFIVTTVGQSEARLREDLASKKDLERLEHKLERLEHKVDARFAGIGDALQTLMKEVEPRLDDHETRITRLEEAA